VRGCGGCACAGYMRAAEVHIRRRLRALCLNLLWEHRLIVRTHKRRRRDNTYTCMYMLCMCMSSCKVETAQSGFTYMAARRRQKLRKAGKKKDIVEHGCPARTTTRPAVKIHGCQCMIRKLKLHGNAFPQRVALLASHSPLQSLHLKRHLKPSY